MITANATRIIIESRSISTVRSEKRNQDGGAREAHSSLMSMTSGNFQIGYYVFGSSKSYYKGEIYEVLVFTQSLYDLDTSGGLITKIYQNQLGAYGT
jgi:hypothetical protein